MTTKAIDPWDLDSYARDIHHLWSYWVSKARGATETSEDEKVEKYTGKLALLSDKVVALCKVKALWWAANVRAGDTDPVELVASLDLDEETKQELTREAVAMKRKSEIARAHRRFADMQNNINGADELAMVTRWFPSSSKKSERRARVAEQR